MTTLLLILAFIAVFVLGGIAAFWLLAIYIVEASNKGELGIAFWKEKEGHWKVIGSYLAIAGKLTILLRHNPEKVKYVDTATKKSKYKVKVGAKR